MIKKIKNNIFAFEFSEFGSLVYLIQLKEKNILIDTSSSENKKELRESLMKLGITPKNVDTIILTHTHWDHIGNLDLFKKAKIFSYKNVEKLKIKEFKIIKTPGHTKDSICILYNKILFSGDTIFHKGYIGRTDFPESSSEQMKKSLEKIKKLDFKILCPGHLV